MILFLSQFDDTELKKFSSEFMKKTGIKISYKTVPDIINKSTVTITCTNNNFSSIFDGVNFDEIKLCYVNTGVSAYKNYFDFDSELDNEYASMEWTALITCLTGANAKTKFINKCIPRYYCNNQLEDSMIFQKFDIDTPESFLTNNTEDFLNFYHIYNENLIIKNIISKNKICKVFSVKDIKKLNKLHLSPYVFQKRMDGIFVSVLIIGESVLAVDETTRNSICIPLGIKEKLMKIAAELNVYIVKFGAIFKDDLFFFYDIDQTCTFFQLQALFGDKFTDTLTKFLVKEYKNDIAD